MQGACAHLQSTDDGPPPDRVGGRVGNRQPQRHARLRLAQRDQQPPLHRLRPLAETHAAHEHTQQGGRGEAQPGGAPGGARSQAAIGARRSRPPLVAAVAAVAHAVVDAGGRHRRLLRPARQGASKGRVGASSCERLVRAVGTVAVVVVHAGEQNELLVAGKELASALDAAMVRWHTIQTILNGGSECAIGLASSGLGSASGNYHGGSEQRDYDGQS